MAVRSHLYSFGILLRSRSWACETRVEVVIRMSAPGRQRRRVETTTCIGSAPSRLDDLRDKTEARLKLENGGSHHPGSMKQITSFALFPFLEAMRVGRTRGITIDLLRSARLTRHQYHSTPTSCLFRKNLALSPAMASFLFSCSKRHGRKASL